MTNLVLFSVFTFSYIKVRPLKRKYDHFASLAATEAIVLITSVAAIGIFCLNVKMLVVVSLQLYNVGALLNHRGHSNAYTEMRSGLRIVRKHPLIRDYFTVSLHSPNGRQIACR